MKQEDKELLLKDLCARLPYGIILNVPIDGDGHFADRQLVKITVEDEYPIAFVLVKKSEDSNCASLLDGYFISDTKPYLRPMSSMTKDEYESIKKEFLFYGDSILHNGELLTCGEAVDWLNEHHFDYHGLIEKGLALEAPEGMYKFN